MNKLLFWLVVLPFLGLAFFYTPKNVTATDKSWVSYSDVRFNMIQEYGPGFTRPATLYGQTGNRDCVNEDITTQPPKGLFFITTSQKLTETRCVVETIFGTTDGSILVRGGTDVGGPLMLRSNKEGLLVGSNVSSGITVDSTGAPGGAGFVAFSRDLYASIKTTINSDGTVKHELIGNGGLLDLKNMQGGKLLAQISTASFSNNGNWLLFDSPNYGLVRLNTGNGELLSFGSPTSYSGGYNPNYQTAISSDGRYAVVSALGRLDIYDLDNCSPQSGALADLKNCQMRSLNAERQVKTNFGLAAVQLRFTSDDAISYYTAQRQGGPSGPLISRLYRMTLGDVPQYAYEYLGLGDSFASGEGAFGYKSVTDNENNKCHLSLLSYPYLIGESLNKEKYESIACSGATSEDVYPNDSGNYGGQAGETYDGIIQSNRSLTDFLQTFLPGKLTQQYFMSQINPEAITISIGGNDIGFADKIRSCVADLINQTCFDTYEERQEAVNEVAGIVPKLKKTYEALKTYNRRVYVVGYPKIIDPNGDCANNVKLNNSEADFADKLTGLLDDVVEVAAKQAGVVYVNVEDILNGKRLCETDSDQTLINGITQGNDTGLWKFKVLAQESFHPKAGAHERYKTAIIEQTDNLTKPMPAPDPSASFSPPDAISDFWFVEKQNRTLFNTIYMPTLDTVTLGDTVSHDYPASQTGLQPDSNVSVELHSTPINLGEFTTDSVGNLYLNITIPADLPAGFHSLHIYGRNITGQPVDIYDYFFVRASDTDYDGDGTPDTQEGCMVADPVEADSDKDGVDDACDGFADPLPIVPPDDTTQSDPEQNTTPPPAADSDTPVELPEIVPVPVITNVDNPKEVGNSETVAGIGDMPSKPETEKTQDPVSKPTVNTATQVVAPDVVVAPTPPTLAPEPEPQVLGAEDSSIVEPDTSSEGASPVTADPPTYKKDNHVLGYIAAAVLALLALIGLIYQRKKT